MNNQHIKFASIFAPELSKAAGSGAFKGIHDRVIKFLVSEKVGQNSEWITAKLSNKNKVQALFQGDTPVVVIINNGRWYNIYDAKNGKEIGLKGFEPIKSLKQINEALDRNNIPTNLVAKVPTKENIQNWKSKQRKQKDLEDSSRIPFDKNVLKKWIINNINSYAKGIEKAIANDVSEYISSLIDLIKKEEDTNKINQMVYQNYTKLNNKVYGLKNLGETLSEALGTKGWGSGVKIYMSDAKRIQKDLERAFSGKDIW